MNFNYRDFFIHNDDLHIIKEQLSIVDEVKVSKKDALGSNAKAVWDMYDKKEPNEQNIASALGINVETVQKIIFICLKNIVEKKNPTIIAKELAKEFKSDILNATTVQYVINNALGSERERDRDIHFIIDAVKIYEYHINGKTPNEIVDLVNSEKPKHSEINLDKVNLVLNIVDIAKKQMEAKGVVNAPEIHREIGKKISAKTILDLITNLNLGKPRYKHAFTEEQDAFILYLYLQRNGPSEIARKFNKEFKDSEGNVLNIMPTSTQYRLRNVILKPKGESEISDYVLDLLNKYRTKYFSTVDINDPKLTHYTAPETIKGRDTTGTGTNRDMSAHLGTLPKNFNTMITNLER